MDDPRLSRIQQLADPIFAEASAEVVECSCHRQGGQLMVRFLIDKVGGVSLQECARLNRRIGQVLDADPDLAESYTLEVSSPGLDRPLVTKRDFERALGEALHMDVVGEDGKGRPAKGDLLAVQHEAIVLKTPSGNVTIPFGQIQRAKRAIRW